MKPISTLMRPLRTVDMITGEPTDAVRERSDVCAVPAAGVVGEQMAAFVLAGEFQRNLVATRSTSSWPPPTVIGQPLRPTREMTMAGGDDGRRKNQRRTAGAERLGGFRRRRRCGGHGSWIVHPGTVGPVWEAEFRSFETTVIKRIAGTESRRLDRRRGGPRCRQSTTNARHGESGLAAGWAHGARAQGSSRWRPTPLQGDPDRTARITQLLQERSRAYEDAADYEIDTSPMTVEEVAMRIEQLWTL